MKNCKGCGVSSNSWKGTLLCIVWENQNTETFNGDQWNEAFQCHSPGEFLAIISIGVAQAGTQATLK